jgi:hypothetical protein
MKYIYVFLCFLYAPALVAYDDYMPIAPEVGGEKEMEWEPTSDQGDAPKSDIHENDAGPAD